MNIMLFALKHAEGTSKVWLHCPVVQADAWIVKESHLLSWMESETEYVIV